jgi:hypothetical protein
MKARLLFAAIVAAALAGCAGNNPYDPSLINLGANPTFALSGPSTASINWGSSTTVPVTVSVVGQSRPSSRALGDVTLSASGLPTGATVTFAPNPVSPTENGVVSTMTINSTGAMPSGSVFDVTVTGTDGTDTRTVHVSLTVNSPSTTFAIQPVASQTIPRFDTATFTITIDQVSRAFGDVTLSVGGLPPGSAATFSQNPVTPTVQGTTVTMTVDTDAGFNMHGSIGTNYTLTITGTDGIDTRSVTTTLTLTG